jgi:hypothetical protein
VGAQNLDRAHAARWYTWCGPPRTGRERIGPTCGRRRAGLVLGLATAWYDQVSPEQAEDLITRAFANGADGVALQSLPYW